MKLLITFLPSNFDLLKNIDNTWASNFLNEAKGILDQDNFEKLNDKVHFFFILQVG